MAPSKPRNQFLHVLSYLLEQRVECTSSAYNPYMEVSYHRGQYKLATRNAVYSFGTQYRAFAGIFDKIGMGHKKISNVLLLGAGLGSIPQLLARYSHHIRFTAVEIDPVVIDLARKYVAPDIINRMTFICADGFEYVSRHAETAGIGMARFDLIAMDIFVDTDVPAKFDSERFLENLKLILSENGTLLYNRMTVTSELLRNSESFYEERFSKVFPGSRKYYLNGNMMLAYMHSAQ